MFHSISQQNLNKLTQAKWNISDEPITVNQNFSGISKRLGPPQAKPFIKKGSTEERGGIFNRLGGTVADAQGSAFSRLDDKPASADLRLAKLKRKSEPIATESRIRDIEGGKFDGSSRLHNDEKEKSSDDDNIAAVPIKKKQFVLVLTNTDGTKTQRIISSDDPILNKVCHDLSFQLRMSRNRSYNKKFPRNFTLRRI